MRWKRWNWLSQEKEIETGYPIKRFIKGNLVTITSPSLFKVLAENIINNCW